MKHSSRPQSIAWFQDHYKDGRLILRPPFQRKPVWSDKQRCALVESALLNVPIPEVYIQVTHSGDGTETFGVIDGQQRLRSLLQFVGLERSEDQDGTNNNNFKLTALPDSSRFKGVSFADLSDSARKKFYQYEICVRFIYSEDQRQIEDVFKRLNKFMMPLKAQELRNATYHGAFAKLSETLADDAYWAVNRIVTPAAIRRMSDIEMMSDLLIGLMHGPQGGSAKIIDSYYESYEQYEDEFPEQNRVRRTFDRTKQLIERLFEDISVERWGNRADFYSLFVALGSLLESHALPKSKEPQVRDELIKFASQVDKKLEGTSRTQPAGEYASAIEKGSNDRARRAERHAILQALLRKFFKERN